MTFIKIKKFIIIISILVILFILSLSLIKVQALIIENVKYNTPIFTEKIQPGDEFIIKWMHSVELQPWEEIFRIDNNYSIILDRTRFKQFGAGVPDYAGNKTEIKDGYIIFSGINKEMDTLPYGISDFAKHRFVFNDQEIKLYEVIEDGESINIYCQELSLLSYLRKKLLPLIRGSNFFICSIFFMHCLRLFSY